MAITLLTEPFDTTSIKNPVQFKLTSTNQTKCGFRFVGNLYIQKEPWNGSAYTKVIEVRKYPLQSTSDQGVFDFSNILEDFIKLQYDLLTGTPKIGVSNSYLRYYVIFEEEYEDLCDGISAKYNPITVTNKTVFNGRIDFNNYKKFLTNNWYFYESAFLSGAPVWTPNVGSALNPPLYEGYTHTVRPNDNFPVIFNKAVTFVVSPYKVFLAFETIQSNGLKKFKLPDITPYLISKLSESYQWFATDFGTRQTDDLSQGNINSQVIDSETVSYTAVVVSSDNTTTTDYGYYDSGTVNIPIPDNTGYAKSDISVPVSVLPTEILVKVNITHPYLNDLIVNLVSPSGKIINLYNKTIAGSVLNYNFVNTVFSSNSSNPSITTGTPPGYTGTWRWVLGNGVGSAPYVANTITMKTVLNDYSSYGTWSLVVFDRGAADVGTILNWSIKFKAKTLLEVTPKHKFNLISCGTNNNIRFYWLNKLGGWDSFSFTKNKTKRLEATRSNYEKYVDYQNYNLFDAGASQYDTQITYSESVYSDWIDPVTSEWLSEMFSSPVVYMQDNSDYQNQPSSLWNTLPYPALGSSDVSIQRIVITDNSYSYVTKNTTKLTNINLSYQLANQNNIIRL